MQIVPPVSSTSPILWLRLVARFESPHGPTCLRLLCPWISTLYCYLPSGCSQTCHANSTNCNNLRKRLLSCQRNTCEDSDFKIFVEMPTCPTDFIFFRIPYTFPCTFSFDLYSLDISRAKTSSRLSSRLMILRVWIILKRITLDLKKKLGIFTTRNPTKIPSSFCQT